MIERQTIVTWYTPREKLPVEDVLVVVTISGRGPYISYDHALMIASWAADDGWTVEGLDTDTTQFTVHAWCDLLPYGIKGGRTC